MLFQPLQQFKWSDPRRSGQCHPPMCNLRFFGLLHTKLRTFDHCLKLLYHLVSQTTNCWSTPSDSTVGQQIKAAKQSAIEHIWQQFLVDSPTSNGGNTNVGNTAQLFFKEENRQKIVSMIPDEAHRANFDKLLRLLNIFISLVQDCDISKKPNSAKLKELGIEIMMFHKTSFPFARITPTVHITWVQLFDNQQ